MARIEFLLDGIVSIAGNGKSILDCALEDHVPFVHSCGGKARCSTCRVAIVDGIEQCSPRTEAEEVISKRLEFPDTVRLACQTKANGDIRVRRLVRDPQDQALIGDLRKVMPGPVGHEQNVAVLFADIRGFTSFSEHLPPYDVVHVLNRYFQSMEDAVRTHDGGIYNYMGDGFMALFGADGRSDCPVSDAVFAAFDMLKYIEKLRPYFQSIYDKCFQIGIGIHYGNVVIGEIGARESKRITAIGDAVNVASRIESMTKKAGCALLISEKANQCIADKFETLPKCTDIALSGKAGRHTLYEVISLTKPAIKL